MHSLIIILTCIAAFPVLIMVINNVNQMDKCTPHMIRLAFTLVGVGALAVMVAPLFGKPSSWGNFLLLLGVALLFYFDRRRQVWCKA